SRMVKPARTAKSRAVRRRAPAARRRDWLLALATVVTCAVLVSLLFQRPAPLAVPPAPAHYLDDQAGLVSWQFAAAKNQYLEHLSRTMRIAHINIVILPRSPAQDI